MKQYDILYIFSQAVAIAAAVGVKPVGDLIDSTFHTGLGSAIVGVLAIVALVGGKIVDRLKNPSPAAGSAAVVAPKDADPIRVKDLSTTPGAEQAQKVGSP